MSAVRRLRNSWILWVTTIVLVCFSNAFAQASYKVTDLGVLHSDNNLGCAMSVNDEGWTFIMSGTLPPGEQDSQLGTLLNGRGVLGIDGFKFDLGTLGGENTWMNWGQINDWGQIVGYSETAVPDPNGEDVCGFGTHLTCSPFIWQVFHMSALRTLGGNNGQASGINLSGQIAGFAENGDVDSTCPLGTTNNRIDLGAFWENGNPNTNPKALSPLSGDPDSIAFGINDQGQAVGYSGTCTLANHAVVWNNGTPTPLPDLGVEGLSLAWAINDQGQMVGEVLRPDGATDYAALWPNPNEIIDLKTLPGDFGSLASGISPNGQIVVGSTWDSKLNWSHAFIYQNGTMTDLNTLLPASSNLYATMGNKINARGQISGMATVLTGPDAGNIHAFLATPVHQSIGMSMADAARIHPRTTLPANVGNQLLRRFAPGQLVRKADPTTLPLQP
jgi:probable HAF family extracellular repeat protein